VVARRRRHSHMSFGDLRVIYTYIDRTAAYRRRRRFDQFLSFPLVDPPPHRRSTGLHRHNIITISPISDHQYRTIAVRRHSFRTLLGTVLPV